MSLTWYNGLQLLLTVIAIGCIGQRFRIVLFQGLIDSKPFLTALKFTILEDKNQDAQRLITSARPAWVAELAYDLMQARENGTSLEVASVDSWVRIQEEMSKGIYLIFGFARIASPLAFLGVIIELAQGFSSRSSVSSLQAGLVESQAISQALITLMIGLGTSTVCFVGGGILRKHVRQTKRTLDRVSRTLEEALTFLDQTT